MKNACREVWIAFIYPTGMRISLRRSGVWGRVGGGDLTGDIEVSRERARDLTVAGCETQSP